jgi:CRISPR-associated protein Csb1
MTNLTFERLRNAVAHDAALRRVQRLQPAGGPGDKIFPPTYPGERTNDPARHLFETRRIDGVDVRCVLIDSVQSQANRLEDALLAGIRAGRFAIPHIVVDFTGQQAPNGVAVGDLGQITSLDAPHRVFDAIIRDSELDGAKFTETDYYEQLLLVSEIVGVGVAEGQKGAVRLDPLGIRASVKVVGGPLDWRIATGEKGEKSERPSEINHSNIISNLVPGGVTIDHARHTAVITCAGLRRLGFPGKDDETAGRTVLAALALVALTEQERSGYALRSRCDLVCDGHAPFEIVHPDGSSESFDADADLAVALLDQSVEAAKAAGLTWNVEPIRLTPQPRLVELVALSREKALAEESEGENA